MNEPSAMIIGLRGFLFLIVAVVLPQGCGFALIRWAWKQQRKIAIIPALFIAPIIFFAFAYVFWGMQAKAIKETGLRVCGAFGAAASLSTIAGTVVHFLLSCAVLLVIWYRNRQQDHLSR